MGVVRDVHTPNDITVNRAMVIFGGYIFDPKGEAAHVERGLSWQKYRPILRG